MRQNRTLVWATLLGAGCLLAASSPALANAGTGLIWAAAFHLIVVNLLIGLGEGIILKLVFRAQARVFVLMIAANYVSMIGGFYLLLRLFSDSSKSTSINVHNAMGFIVAAWLLMFAVTVVLEWPFCWLSLGKRPRRAAAALGALLVVNVASYAVLVPVYSYTSGWGVMWQVEPERSLLATAPAGMCVYYLSLDTGDLWRVGLDGRNCRKVHDLGATAVGARLFARPSPSGQGYDLWVNGCPDYNRERIVVPAFADQVGRPSFMHGWDHEASTTEPRVKEPYGSFGFGDWDVWAGGGAAGGLIAIHKRTGEQVVAAMNVPFLAWRARNATVISANQVVYQLGVQIVLLDLDARKIALIAIGEDPVVASGKSVVATMPSLP